MRSYWIRVGPKSNAWCPHKKRRGTQRYMQRKEDPVKVEVENGVMQP